jgi:uncharacterized protein YjbI with pentapeptide repeats
MANQEQLEILLQGARVWNVWRRREHPEVRIDLRGAILKDVDLSGMTLSEADLRGYPETCLGKKVDLIDS